ncbi:UNVERIFIED_CONTAM: hypothetical protein FKN15_028201 [Acipenser sinensis]
MGYAAVYILSCLVLACQGGKIGIRTGGYLANDAVVDKLEHLKAAVETATEGAQIDWPLIMGVKQREGELVQEYGVRKWEAYRDYSGSEDPKEQDQVFVQVLISVLGPHLHKSIELGANPGTTYDAVVAWGGMVENRRKENKEGKGDLKNVSVGRKVIINMICVAVVPYTASQKQRSTGMRVSSIGVVIGAWVIVPQITWVGWIANNATLYLRSAECIEFGDAILRDHASSTNLSAQMVDATVHPKLGYENGAQMQNGTWCVTTSVASMITGGDGQVCQMPPTVCFDPRGVVTVGHLSLHLTPPINISATLQKVEDWMKTINHTGVLRALGRIEAQLAEVSSRVVVATIQASLAGNTGQLI